MDHFRGRQLLLIALYIETTVLMIVESSCREHDLNRNYCCATHECLEPLETTPMYRETESTTIMEETRFVELSFNKTSQDFVSCWANHCTWYKRGMCVNCTTPFSEDQFSYFSGNFRLRDQGNYFSYTSPDSSTSLCLNVSRVFVTIKGADTYLGTFNLTFSQGGNIDERGISCSTTGNSDRLQKIEGCVKQAYCRNLQANKCDYAVQEMTCRNFTVVVRGLLYLRDFPNIREIERELEMDSARCSLQSSHCRKFRRVSFCKFERMIVASAGNLTFQKTNIGMKASSIEMCPDGKPRATRMCQGDFISPSRWAAPDEMNCSDEGDGGVSRHKTENPMTTKENVTTAKNPLTTDPLQEGSSSLSMTININGVIGVTNYTVHEFTTVPAIVISDSNQVSTTNITEAITMLNQDDDTSMREEKVKQVSLMLSEDTRNTESIDAVYLIWVSEMLTNISEVGSSSEKVTSSVMEIVDNLLRVKEDIYEESISGDAPSRILRALETQLTNVQRGGRNFTNIRSSVGAVALRLERSAFQENITFGVFSSMAIEGAIENLQESEVDVMIGKDDSPIKYPATITLPPNLLDTITTEQNDSVPVTFIIHRTSLLFMSGSSQRRRQRERVESLVIAATLEGQNISNLSSPVISRFHLPHVQGTMTKNGRKCVFWDFTLADGFGDWSSEGCELVSGSRDSSNLIVECHCNHLTNFAVLLDVQGDIDHIVLDILSIIGCAVSIFALIITVIVLLAVKKLREQVPQQIIINLCFALLGLYICFLVGINQSNLETGCIIFGALIHYFCLASVAWMCIVAINMYLLFVRVFNADITGFMWKACLAAWGLPIIVVVVSVILKHQDYSSSYCFPQTGTLTFYLGVLLLIGLMLCFNLVIFMLIFRQVTCGRIGKPAGQDKRREMLERAQSIIIISVLLGLTWVFGFLSVGGARFFFNLLFLIFNSLQGFFVFVFFVLRPKNVRMILFKRCYRSEETKIGRYTVNKSKIDGNDGNKDTLNLNDIVVTSSQT